MYDVFVILAVITAVLLAFIVLIQESKGGGLASDFASSNQIMGVRKTTDVIEKTTWTLAALLVIRILPWRSQAGLRKHCQGYEDHSTRSRSRSRSPARTRSQDPTCCTRCSRTRCA